MSPARSLASTATLSLFICAALPGQQPAADSSILTLDRIYASDEFQPEHLGEVRWLPDRPAYLKLEDTKVTFEFEPRQKKAPAAKKAPAPAKAEG